MNDSTDKITSASSVSPAAPFSGHSIIKKTLAISGSTFLSRVLGIAREILSVSFLGAGAVSDAFLTAYKIPNSLRKIFAEGALSAAFIPTLVKLVREKNHAQAHSLMSLAFLFFESIVLILCILGVWKAELIISLIAPGFSPEQVALAVPFLRILMPFIFFLSSSALLAGALQSVGHFFVPAFSPVLLNLVFIGGLMTCITFSLPVTYLCVFILFGGLLQLIAHVIAYWRLNFSFGPIDKQSLKTFQSIFAKFFLCSISMSIVEISLFIDTSFASYLPNGSISLIYYANRFMGIPLGIFAVAFSTILLPHFSRVSTYAPKRLHFYLLEASKLVFWVTIPATLCMSFFAEKIFHTMFLSDKFTIDQVIQASHILIAFSIGLFFFAVNKILLNLYYALHVTWVPAAIAASATVINILLNVLFINHFQATGLACATTIAGAVQTIALVTVLHKQYHFSLYGTQFLSFAKQYCTQLACTFTLFYAFFKTIEHAITLLPAPLATFFLYKIGFWFWVGPLTMACMGTLYYTRNWFNINLYFLGSRS